MFNRLIRCLMLALGFITLQAENATLFSIVSDLYIKSLPLEPAQQKLQPSQGLTFNIRQLSVPEQQAALFKAIAQSAPVSPDSHTISLDATFLKKTQLYCGGEKPGHNLLDLLNHTQTIAGQAELAYRLATPTANISELERRQAITKELLAHTALRHELQSCLQEFSRYEGMLYSYFTPEDPVNTELFKKVYFQGPLAHLNKSVGAMEASTRLANIFSAYGALAAPIMVTGLLGTLKDRVLGKNPGLLDTLKVGIKNLPLIPKYLNPYSTSYSNVDLEGVIHVAQLRPDFISSYINQYYPHNLGDLFKIIDNLPPEMRNNINPLAIKGAIVGYIGLVGGALGYSAYKIIADELLKKNIANHLQAKLIGVAHCIKAINKVYLVIKGNELLRTLPEYTILESVALKSPRLSANLHKLLELLDHNTFTGTASFFSLTGRVLVAEQLMKEVALEFLPVIRALGGIDAYQSVATLYQAFEKEEVHYSFVTFVKNKTPYIAAHNFWNPFVDPKKVVTNSLIVGTKENPNNFVVTGPNTCGKSTLINALLIDVLIAQVTGIAPADQLIMTPFSNLFCYLNITDDIATGVSLFKAEVLRAKALIEALRTLPEDQFSFTIMDEIFSGTSPKEGEAAAYKFAQEIAKFSNSICGIATHYAQLTELEDEGTHKNYHVSVIKNDDGTLTRPFIITEGKSTQNIAFDLLEQEGIF